MNSQARAAILGRIDVANLPSHAHPGAFASVDANSRSLEEIIAACGASCVTSPTVSEFERTLLRDLAPDTNFYSLVEELDGGTFRGSLSIAELLEIPLTIVRGSFIVLEHGAVWIPAPQPPRQSAALFTCKKLVILVSRNDVVPTMIEATARISHAPGWFICGPSKTADIEQCLVIGAQGALAVTVVLLD